MYKIIKYDEEDQNDSQNLQKLIRGICSNASAYLDTSVKILQVDTDLKNDPNLAGDRF